MPRVKLTDRTIQALKPPDRGQVDYFDETTSGFGVRLSQGCRKAFFVMYRFEGRLRRHTFGTYPASASRTPARRPRTHYTRSPTAGTPEPTSRPIGALRPSVSSRPSTSRATQNRTSARGR